MQTFLHYVADNRIQMELHGEIINQFYQEVFKLMAVQE